MTTQQSRFDQRQQQYKRFQFQDPGHCNLGRSRLFTRFGRGPRCIQAGYANQLTLINRRMSATPYSEIVD